MKKFLCICLACLLVFCFVSCQKSGDSADGGKPLMIDEPSSHDELVRKAQEEGRLVVYAITSRFGDVAKGFYDKYGITVEASNVKDKEIYTKVTTEISGGTFGADLIVVHDTYRIQAELLATGYCFTQVPNSLKSKVPAQYQDPFIWQFINKLFVYNTEFNDGKPPFDNIWGATDPKYKGSIYIKDANTEGGNFNFFTMLTHPDWSSKLAAAYKQYYGKDIQIPSGQTAGHVWIRDLLANTIGNDSETNIARDVAVRGQNKQWMGWTAYSKFRALTDTTRYAIDAIDECTPFSTYLQPYYILLTSNLQHPHAALLFTEYIFTDEGFAPWGEEVGSYPVTSDLFVADENKLDYWEARAISDDPEFLAEKRFGVEEFVNSFYYK